jgi:hypothetical protein
MNTLWGKVAVLLSSSLAAGLLVNFLAWRATARHDASVTALASVRAPNAVEPAEDLDDVLAQSFPASDPPSSNPGTALVSARRR